MMLDSISSQMIKFRITNFNEIFFQSEQSKNFGKKIKYLKRHWARKKDRHRRRSVFVHDVFVC